MEGSAAVPDVVVLLDVDLVEHHVLLLGVDVSLHLHGNVAGKHGEQETLLYAQTKGGQNRNTVVCCVCVVRLRPL